MIVLHIDTELDTHVMSVLYDNMTDAIILVNPMREEFEEVMRQHPGEPFMCIGHGSPCGLFAAHGDEWSHIIDDTNVDLLMDREVIGIWCHADMFAEQYGLHGFFTHMFISNPTECACFAMDEHSYEECNEQNVRFATLINEYVRNGKPLNEWVETLQASHDDVDFVNYNYDHLQYFE